MTFHEQLAQVLNPRAGLPNQTYEELMRLAVQTLEEILEDNHGNSKVPWLNYEKASVEKFVQGYRSGNLDYHKIPVNVLNILWYLGFLSYSEFDTFQYANLFGYSRSKVGSFLEKVTLANYNAMTKGVFVKYNDPIMSMMLYRTLKGKESIEGIRSISSENLPIDHVSYDCSATIKGFRTIPFGNSIRILLNEYNFNECRKTLFGQLTSNYKIISYKNKGELFILLVSLPVFHQILDNVDLDDITIY